MCHERGWIYEGTDVMPWCPRCGTGLSQQEINEGYRDIVHPGLYLTFPLLDREGESLLVWTTTPWTLTGNTGAYVHPKLTYVKVRTDDGVLFLLKSRLSELKRQYEVLEEMPGAALDGLRYRGPFDELPSQRGVDRRVVLWEEVSESEGTGIVHTAPGAGAVDFQISKERGLAVIAPLDEFGVFVEGFDWLTGKSVIDVNDAIYDSLRQKGVLYRLEEYTHRYPVCWRCETEVVFRLVDEWFISMDELRDLVSRVTRKVTWVPAFGLQRELDWLKNMDDWMISKKRYWGLALPIYKCGECGHFDVIGSETELEARAIEGWDEFQGHSPHRPWIDAVKIQCSECGATVPRLRDVGNVWLDAGIVPFSTIGYRGNREYWKEWFPADLVTESFPGQFRGWFYSLLVMSTVLEDTESFRSLHSYATMRDEHGEEMHKSRGNAVWFDDGAEKMGVDSMRWLYTRHDPAANLNFGFNVADEVRRRFMIPLWNVYSFFETYANIDGYDPRTEAPPVEDRPELDRWIISELNELIVDVTAALERYAPEAACLRFESFVGYLSNWYVRRSRRRFWKSEADQDKLSAHSTLYECLVAVTRLLAPFVPFMTEAMYQNLVRSVDGQYESVHLEPYPESDAAKIDRGLSEATRLAMRLSSLGRAARSKAGIKVRQPLERALVKLQSASERAAFEQVKDQVRDELNVKDVAELEDEGQVVSLHVEADLSRVGPKYGGQTSQVVAALRSSDPRDVHRRVSGGHPVDVGEFTLEPDEVSVTRTDAEGFVTATEADYTVAVTTVVSHELELEGLARELVHVVQNMRRSAGFDIADHVEMYLTGAPELDELVAAHGDYIRQETLSDAISREEPPENAFAESHKVNGREATIGLVRRIP